MKTYKKSFLSGKSILQIVILTSLFFAVASCKDDDNNTDTFQAFLNGASETPPNASTATGTATLTYNKDTKIFTVVVDYTGITPTQGHIHKEEVGVAGAVVFPFTSLTSPITYTSPALTASQEADLYAFQYYVNLHTTLFPAGEIRGQLIQK
jgi:hypothetical protein